MASRLYVGNLPYDVSVDDLHQLFSEAGRVESVDIPVDRETGRARGFAFVQMASDEDAQNAIQKLDGVTVDSRRIRVNIAREREEVVRGYGRRGRS